MSKANVEIKNLIALAQKAKNLAKEETRKQIEDIEIQRHKLLLEAKHECLIEVTDAIVEGIAKIAAIDIGNILKESLRDKIQKFIDRIEGNIDEIQAMFTVQSNSEDSEYYNKENLQYWKQRLQSNIDKIIEIYEKPRDLSKNTLIDGSDYYSLQNKVGEEVVARTHFFQSVKRVEDKEINKFHDKKIKEAEDGLTRNFRHVDADLAEQIGELLLKPITTEVAYIDLNTAHSASIDNVEDQVSSLAGDTCLEHESLKGT